MNFKAYSRLNNLIGWIVFAIAAFTYLSTIEHTVSLWDCGEFVSCYYKLEVPHPPGAPMITLIYRLFTLLAPSPQWVPIMANAASALASAFTILFLFWSITALAIKLVVRDEENMENGTIYAILGAGVVGALAYTFSDTFWFSAVEGEVYALSSMFTALVYWLALKWERRADERHNLRWLVLIFYMIGVVVGVHLLGLLVIPVVVLMYYFRKYSPITPKGVILAVIIGFGALGAVQIGVIQWLPGISSWVDRIFVNSFGLPFWSGVLFFFALVLGVAGYYIYWSHIHKKVILNTALLCLVSVILGYTSYAVTVVRSYANPPIDMNDPEDIYSMLGYLSREQYGDNYLLTGPYYTAYSKGAYKVTEGAMQYRKDKENHVFAENGTKRSYEFEPAYTTIFPRMFNGTQDNYVQGYRFWGNVSKSQEDNNKISFVKNNLRFFFSYQMRYMYWRYFAWNFIGRQNDIQGVMNEFHQGNWLSGIPFIDETIGGTGPSNGLPTYMKWNKARNPLYALPLILGLLGFFYQYKRNKQDFWAVLLFFFMTGIAIELYLNMPSPQPRERDYAFVGSFYVFAIWIGLGVLWVFEMLRKKLNSPLSAQIATAICLIAVPTLMAAREWDDHDRSKRSTALDYGVNYLNSCAKNAILFTNGDNDTYPLWYAQEVEGIRDDIRIVNLSLFGTDWYINQMRHPINHAPGLPFSLTPKQTLGWDYVIYQADLVGDIDQNTPVELSKVIQFIGSSDPSTKAVMQNGESIPFMPTKKLRITINKDEVLKSGTVKPEQADQIVDRIDFQINNTTIMKSNIMVLDLIATNHWRYPIYFSITSGAEEYMNLGSYLQYEGLAYRLLPIKTNPLQETGNDEQRVATDIMFDNVMNKFRWGKSDQHEILMDYVMLRQAENLRGLFARLGRSLLDEGKNDKAIQAMDKCMKVLPEKNVPFNYFVVPIVEIYYRAGAADKGRPIANRLLTLFNEELGYYAKLKREYMQDASSEIQRAMVGLHFLEQIGNTSNDKDLANRAKTMYEQYQARFPMPEQGQ